MHTPNEFVPKGSSIHLVLTESQPVEQPLGKGHLCDLDITDGLSNRHLLRNESFQFVNTFSHPLNVTKPCQFDKSMMIQQLQAEQNIITQNNFAPSSLLQIFSLLLGLTLNGSVSGLL